MSDDDDDDSNGDDSGCNFPGTYLHGAYWSVFFIGGNKIRKSMTKQSLVSGQH